MAARSLAGPSLHATVDIVSPLKAPARLYERFIRFVPQVGARESTQLNIHGHVLRHFITSEGNSEDGRRGRRLLIYNSYYGHFTGGS